VDETGPEPLTDQLPGLDELEQRCWQAFLESSTRLLEMLNRRLVDVHELTMFQFLVLDLLARANGGSARMGDLAQERMKAKAPAHGARELLPCCPCSDMCRLMTSGLWP
jgi:hypothetical protein